MVRAGTEADKNTNKLTDVDETGKEMVNRNERESQTTISDAIIKSNTIRIVPWKDKDVKASRTKRQRKEFNV